MEVQPSEMEEDGGRAVLGDEFVLAYESKEAPGRCVDAAFAKQFCQDLAVSIVDEEGGGEEGADLNPPPPELRAFYIGHSLNSDIPYMVASFSCAGCAPDDPRTITCCEQFIAGAPFRWQWQERDRE